MGTIFDLPHQKPNTNLSPLTQLQYNLIGDFCFFILYIVIILNRYKLPNFWKGEQQNLNKLKRILTPYKPNTQKVLGYKD